MAPGLLLALKIVKFAAAQARAASFITQTRIGRAFRDGGYGKSWPGFLAKKRETLRILVFENSLAKLADRAARPANFAVMLGALLLASCAGTVAEAPPVPLIAEPYDIAEVDVILSKSIVYGAEMIDGSSQKEFAEKVRVSLKQKLTADLVQPKSSRKAIRLEVVLDRVDLSSGIGRAVLKSESNIGGFVSLIDKRTKTALARRNFSAGDNSTRFYGGGSGNLGGVFALGALAANAAQSGDDTASPRSWTLLPPW